MAKHKPNPQPNSEPDSEATSESGTLDFEAALRELETLVERMEKGESTLEESLQDFQRGIELTRSCQESLRQAEQTVRILLEKDGTSALERFEDG